MFWSPWSASGCVLCRAQLKLSATTYARGTMTTALYHGRRAATIENADLRVTVLQEGGHIAEIFDKATSVNPLWTPPCPTVDISRVAYQKLRRWRRCAAARRYHGAQPVPRYFRS